MSFDGDDIITESIDDSTHCSLQGDFTLEHSDDTSSSLQPVQVSTETAMLAAGNCAARRASSSRSRRPFKIRILGKRKHSLRSTSKLSTDAQTNTSKKLDDGSKFNVQSSKKKQLRLLLPNNRQYQKDQLPSKKEILEGSYRLWKSSPEQYDLIQSIRDKCQDANEVDQQVRSVWSKASTSVRRNFISRAKAVLLVNKPVKQFMDNFNQGLQNGSKSEDDSMSTAAASETFDSDQTASAAASNADDILWYKKPSSKTRTRPKSKKRKHSEKTVANQDNSSNTKKSASPEEISESPSEDATINTETSQDLKHSSKRKQSSSRKSRPKRKKVKEPVVKKVKVEKRKIAPVKYHENLFRGYPKERQIRILERRRKRLQKLLNRVEYDSFLKEFRQVWQQKKFQMCLEVFTSEDNMDESIFDSEARILLYRRINDRLVEKNEAMKPSAFPDPLIPDALMEDITSEQRDKIRQDPVFHQILDDIYTFAKSMETPKSKPNSSSEQKENGKATTGKSYQKRVSSTHCTSSSDQQPSQNKTVQKTALAKNESTGESSLRRFYLKQFSSSLRTSSSMTNLSSLSSASSSSPGFPNVEFTRSVTPTRMNCSLQFKLQEASNRGGAELKRKRKCIPVSRACVTKCTFRSPLAAQAQRSATPYRKSKRDPSKDVIITSASARSRTGELSLAMMPVLPSSYLSSPLSPISPAKPNDEKETVSAGSSYSTESLAVSLNSSAFPVVSSGANTWRTADGIVITELGPVSNFLNPKLDSPPFSRRSADFDLTSLPLKMTNSLTSLYTCSDDDLSSASSVGLRATQVHSVSSVKQELKSCSSRVQESNGSTESNMNPLNLIAPSTTTSTCGSTPTTFSYTYGADAFKDKASLNVKAAKTPAISFTTSSHSSKVQGIGWLNTFASFCETNPTPVFDVDCTDSPTCVSSDSSSVTE